MREAHKLGITVILSGQGADELLCGYKKYLGFYIQSLLSNKRFFRAFLVFISFIINGSILNQFSFQEAKRYLPRIWKRNELDISGPALKDYLPISLGINNKSIGNRQIDDLKRFSVPFLTHYEDRMSMAWSREIRLPFLDYRMIEFCTKLPTSYKISKAGQSTFLENLLKSFYLRRSFGERINKASQTLKRIG